MSAVTSLCLAKDDDEIDYVDLSLCLALFSIGEAGNIEFYSSNHKMQFLQRQQSVCWTMVSPELQTREDQINCCYLNAASGTEIWER